MMNPVTDLSKKYLPPLVTEVLPAAYYSLTIPVFLTKWSIPMDARHFAATKAPHRESVF
jgi:hypothetical protein